MQPLLRTDKKIVTSKGYRGIHSLLAMIIVSNTQSCVKPAEALYLSIGLMKFPVKDKTSVLGPG